MTADERIEKLLNRFGQTIEDLPKPTEKNYAYEEEHRRAAREAALNWSDMNFINGAFLTDYICHLKDYICHLADVIDRLEIALETALTQFGDDCDKCSTYEYCAGDCRDFFRLSDKFLIAPELEIDYAD